MAGLERAGWDQQRFTIETFSRASLSERGIVAEVEPRLERAKELLTYNGRGFDIPVLLARAAMAGERVPRIAKAHSRQYLGFHADLLDEITAHGAAKRPKLSELCAGLGIPAKLEAARGGVAELAEARDYARIGRYCEVDVVSTWLAAQMWRSADAPGQAIERWTALADAVPAMPGDGRALDPESVALLKL